MAEKDFDRGLTSSDISSAEVRPRRKKRWLVLKIAVAAIVALIILLLAGPTLLSTQPVLTMIQRQVNKRLNGSIDIRSLSLGWRSGINLQAVRVYDSTDTQIAQLDHLIVPEPLWEILRGRFALGDVVCDGLSCDLKFDVEHRLNFDKLIKTSPAPELPAGPVQTAPAVSHISPDATPMKLPAISGSLKITNCRATVSQPGKPTLFVSNVNGDFRIPDINEQITDSLSLNIRSGNGPDGSIHISGTAAAIKQNLIDLNTADVHQKVEVDNVDLQALSPLLSQSSGKLDGLLGIHVALDLTGGKNAAGDAVITIGKSASAPIDQVHLFLNTEGTLADPRNIKLNITSKSVNGDFTGPTLGAVNGTLNADLNGVMSELKQFLPTIAMNIGGAVAVTMTTSGKTDQPPYQSALMLKLAARDLDYKGSTGTTIEEPAMLLKVSATLQGSAAKTVESARNVSLSLLTGDMTSPTIDLLAEAPQIALTGDLSADLHLTHFNADLARLQKQFAPIPQNAQGTIVSQGILTINGQAKYKASALAMDGLNIAADNLQFIQQTSDEKKTAPSVGGSLHLIGSAEADSQKTSVKLTGNLTELTRVLAAYQGKKPDAYAYRGDYTITENSDSRQNSTALQGGLSIDKFQSLNGAAVVFSEDQLAITNDIVMTTIGSDSSIAINNLMIAMQSSGALNIAISKGSIQHLQSSRDLQLQPVMDYDLAKLWPIVQPIMGDKYKTLKISGAFKKQFNITGSYPANQPSTIAIKTVHADGDLAVAAFDYNGLNLQNFILPFTLDNGKVVTVYANKPAGQNLATPAVANGGALDLGDLTLDLTQDPPRLFIPANKLLISKLTINPIFSKSFLAKVLNNPVFTGSNNATGLLDLTMVDCTELPLGDLVNHSVPANTGKADIRFSLSDLHIGLQGISGLASAIKQDSIAAYVKDGTVAIAKGLSTEHISFVSGSYSLNFDGTVRLADNAMIPLNLSIGPLAAIAQNAFGTRDKNVLKYLPDRAIVQIEGTVDHANVRLDKVLTKIIADAGVKALGKGLLGGDKNGGGGGSLGGLLNKLENKK